MGAFREMVSRHPQTRNVKSLPHDEGEDASSSDLTRTDMNDGDTVTNVNLTFRLNVWNLREFPYQLC